VDAVHPAGWFFAVLPAPGGGLVSSVPAAGQAAGSAPAIPLRLWRRYWLGACRRCRGGRPARPWPAGCAWIRAPHERAALYRPQRFPMPP